MLFGIKQKSETEISIGEKKCVERIGVRRGNSSPAAQLSLTSGGLVASIKKSPLRAWRTVSLRSAVFAPLRQDFAWNLLPPDAPHAGTLWYRSVGELMSLVSFNYLIRPCKQVRRNGDANLLGSLEIDRQIEFGRLHES